MDNAQNKLKFKMTPDLDYLHQGDSFDRNVE